LEEFIPEIKEHDGIAGKLPDIIRTIHQEIQNLLLNVHDTETSKGVVFANLNHLIRLTRILGKHFKAFGLPENQAVDLIKTQTVRVYEYLFRNYFIDFINKIDDCLDQFFSQRSSGGPSLLWWPTYHQNDGIYLKCYSDSSDFEEEIQVNKAVVPN